MIDERLTMQEALEVLGCKRTKFFVLRKRHVFLQPVTTGKPMLFSLKDLEKVIELEKAQKIRDRSRPIYSRRRANSRKAVA